MRSLYLNPEGQCVAELDAAAIKSALESGKGVLWVDLLSVGEPEHNVLRETFHFHPLAIEDSTNLRIDTPKIDDYGDYLFIVAQSVSFLSLTERLVLAEIGIFLGRNYVVTVRTTAVAPVDELFERAAENPHLLTRGADFLAHTVIDSVVDLLLPAVEVMDEQLDDLERRILDNPEKALLPQVLLLKRNTLRLRRSILPQRDMVNRLSRGEFDLISRDALIFYRDVYDHIVRVEEMLDGLRDIADGALSSYLSSVNNRMNEIMKVLSVVAVVFLPLTLIASIFGTNLNYSAVFGWHFEGGFYLMLAVMLFLATVMIAYFHRRRSF